jgi:mannonate dehydratase
MGEVGIPVMGYNFSLAGVAGRTTGPLGRGGAETVIIDGCTDEPPIPRGMVWNMIYDPENFGNGVLPSTTSEQLWDRFSRFLKEIVPVAESAGVAMALHPDDPPFDTVRGTPRLVYRIPLYQRVLEIVPSMSNGIECCVETFLDDGDIDILRVVRVLYDNGFDGVIIPDHSPLVTCDTPWLTGMAYALGYIRAAMQVVERGCTIPDASGDVTLPIRRVQ